MSILSKYKLNIAHLLKINYRYFITILVAVGLILLCADDIYFYGSQVYCWDLLLISGVIVFIIAIQLAFKIPEKFDEMFERLVHRGALESNSENLKDLKSDLQHTGRRLAIIIGCALAMLLPLAFIYAFGNTFSIERIPITVLESAGGFIAGTLLGSMCGFGRFGHLIKKYQVTLTIQPNHLDEVG